MRTYIRLFTFLLVAMQSNTIVAENLSEKIISENGMYQITFIDKPSSFLVGEFYSWKFLVVDQNGKPAENAEPKISGGMPHHGHGFPSSPRVQALGGGVYSVEGIKFSMPGYWILRIDVDSEFDDYAILEISIP